MKKKVVLLTLISIAAASVLLFVGCPEEGGVRGPTLVGTWENVTETDPPRVVITITETTSTTNIYGGSAPDWVHLCSVRGTYTYSGDTLTTTLTALTAPYLFSYYDPFNVYYEYPGWYYSWDDATHPYLYQLYSSYGGDVLQWTITLSADGNTLYVTIDGYYGPETIIFARVS